MVADTVLGEAKQLLAALAMGGGTCVLPLHEESIEGGAFKT